MTVEPEPQNEEVTGVAVPPNGVPLQGTSAITATDTVSVSEQLYASVTLYT